MLRKLAVPAGLVLCVWLLAQPLLAQQITDAAEYNTYVAAINETDPAKQIQLIDAYLAKYPNSVVKEQALEIKLGAQQKSNLPVDQTARDILKVNPNNARAELILSFVFMSAPPPETDPNFQQKISDEEAIAKRSIDQLSSMKKPDNVSDADFEKNKNLMGATHYQAIAIIGALRKDNNARRHDLLSDRQRLRPVVSGCHSGCGKSSRPADGAMVLRARSQHRGLERGG